MKDYEKYQIYALLYLIAGQLSDYDIIKTMFYIACISCVGVIIISLHREKS